MDSVRTAIVNAFMDGRTVAAGLWQQLPEKELLQLQAEFSIPDERLADRVDTGAAQLVNLCFEAFIAGGRVPRAQWGKLSPVGISHLVELGVELSALEGFTPPDTVPRSEPSPPPKPPIITPATGTEGDQVVAKCADFFMKGYTIPAGLWKRLSPLHLRRLADTTGLPDEEFDKYLEGKLRHLDAKNGGFEASYERHVGTTFDFKNGTIRSGVTESGRFAQDYKTAEEVATQELLDHYRRLELEEAQTAFTRQEVSWSEVPGASFTAEGITVDGKSFTAKECGSAHEGHSGMCGYMSIADGDGAAALALKLRLAPEADRLAGLTHDHKVEDFSSYADPARLADHYAFQAFVRVEKREVVVADADSGKILRYTSPLVGFGRELLYKSGNHFRRLV